MISIFGGLVLLIIIILLGYILSFALTYWFLSVPLFCFWIYVQVRRDQGRETMPLTPERQAANARAQADIERFNAREAVYRKIAKDERDRVRGK